MQDEPPCIGPCFNEYDRLDRQWLNMLMPNGKASETSDRSKLGLSPPSLLCSWGHENYTRENIETEPYRTWQIVWSSLKSWRRYLIVDKTLHCDFSDWPILLEALGLTPNETIGTVNI